MLGCCCVHQGIREKVQAEHLRNISSQGSHAVLLYGGVFRLGATVRRMYGTLVEPEQS